MVITGKSTVEEIQQSDEFKDVEWHWHDVNGLFTILDSLKRTNRSCEIYVDNNKQICYKLN
jgi:hypothetical protein